MYLTRSRTPDTVVNDVEGVVNDINNVDVNKTFSFPINVNKQFNLASANVVCSPLPDVSLSADAAVNATGAVTLGVVTFSLSAGLNADLGAQLTLKATTSGSIFDSGDIQLFSAGIPGLDIPEYVYVNICSWYGSDMAMTVSSNLVRPSQSTVAPRLTSVLSSTLSSV
jgi:hypothetical protein